MHNIHALCPVVLSSVGWLVIFKWVSEWLLFNANSAIFQIYHGEYSYPQIAPTFIYNWTTYGLRYEYITVNYLVNACFSKILFPPFIDRIYIDWIFYEIHMTVKMNRSS